MTKVILKYYMSIGNSPKEEISKIDAKLLFEQLDQEEISFSELERDVLEFRESASLTARCKQTNQQITITVDFK